MLGVRSGYLGGAHGYSGYAGMNYDPESGKLLKLSELVAEEGAFKEKVKEEVLSRYPDVEKDLTEAYFQEKSLDDMIWTAGCEGITCYFDAYTLGPYAMGTQNVSGCGCSEELWRRVPCGRISEGRRTGACCIRRSR